MKLTRTERLSSSFAPTKLTADRTRHAETPFFQWSVPARVGIAIDFAIGPDMMARGRFVLVPAVTSPRTEWLVAFGE